MKCGFWLVFSSELSCLWYLQPQIIKNSVKVIKKSSPGIIFQLLDVLQTVWMLTGLFDRLSLSDLEYGTRFGSTCGAADAAHVLTGVVHDQ